MERICPDLDAHLFFDPDEIQAAFLARKSDGEPGIKTIWLGLKDADIAVRTMRALRQVGDQTSCV